MESRRAIRHAVYAQGFFGRRLSRFSPRSYRLAEDAVRLQPAPWAGHFTKERKMVKKILAALLLASAVAFAPVAASAHYTGYRHHHHGYGHHYHHYCR
jgi:hypothetical protein